MLEDLDPAETRERTDALDSVMTFEGADRTFFLLDDAIAETRRKGASVLYSATGARLTPPRHRAIERTGLTRRRYSGSHCSLGRAPACPVGDPLRTPGSGDTTSFHTLTRSAPLSHLLKPGY